MSIEKAAEAQQSWLALIETLVPSKTVTVMDAYGNEYTVSTVLPMRKQQQVIQKLLTLSQLPVLNLGDFGPELAAASPTEQIRVLLGFLRDLVSQESVSTILTEVIALAYPGLVAQALETNKKHKPKDAGDLFEIDQVFALLSPLAIRLGSGLLTQVRRLQSPSAPKTSSAALAS